jgi:hypothetical protein
MMNSIGLGTDNWWPPDEQAAVDFNQYSAEFDLSRCRRDYDAVTQAAKKVVRRPSDGRTLADDLRRRIEGAIPTSYIRLGDADGNVLLTGIERFEALQQYCCSKISKIYFGNADLMWRRRDFFRSIVLQAIEHADVIGAPDWRVIERSFSIPVGSIDVRGMCGMRGVYNFLAGSFQPERLRDVVWASTWYSRSLLPFYFELLERLPYVGFVTCYENLASRMAKRCSIGRTETFVVPMQASIAYQTKKSPDMTEDIGHFPGVYERILDSLLPPHKGAVYVVAAGILSKSYCSRIKERGGIALDVGSVADVWMNIRSRPSMSPDFVDRWAIKP